MAEWGTCGGFSKEFFFFNVDLFSQNPIFKGSYIPWPYVPRLCVPQTQYSQDLMFQRTLCFQGPMLIFLGLCVPKNLHSQCSMFPRPYVPETPRTLCSQNSIVPGSFISMVLYLFLVSYILTAPFVPRQPALLEFCILVPYFSKTHITKAIFPKVL